MKCQQFASALTENCQPYLITLLPQFIAQRTFQDYGDYDIAYFPNCTATHSQLSLNDLLLSLYLPLSEP